MGNRIQPFPWPARLQSPEDRRGLPAIRPTGVNLNSALRPRASTGWRLLPCNFQLRRTSSVWGQLPSLQLVTAAGCGQFWRSQLPDLGSYRRNTLTQLNRGEGRHRLGRTVFHGQRGELRQRYREGQEDQLGALGLVLNALILWNTRYMDAALSHLRARGKQIRPEDVARLSPPRKQTLQCTRTLPFPRNRFHPKRRTPSPPKPRESY